MAGGQGKRFDGSIKVLQCIFGKPMLVHLVETIRQIAESKIIIVVGAHRNDIVDRLNICLNDISDIQFVDQDSPLGTGYAIRSCLEVIESYIDSKVLILSGDTPLITAQTCKNMLRCLDISNGVHAVVMTRYTDKPFGLGRIIETTGSNPTHLRIIEEKDATEQERRVNKVNCGIYSMYAKTIANHIMQITTDNAQHEYYLTDIFNYIDSNHVTQYIIPNDAAHESMGVNTREELQLLEELVGKVQKYHT
jgi:bifunctional UDP-N-acetylglucosamine pyrophosphorylase/glucosamine-1-phosphate N-acetyltransferase